MSRIPVQMINNVMVLDVLGDHAPAGDRNRRIVGPTDAIDAVNGLTSLADYDNNRNDSRGAGRSRQGGLHACRHDMTVRRP